MEKKLPTTAAALTEGHEDHHLLPQLQLCPLAPPPQLAQSAASAVAKAADNTLGVKMAPPRAAAAGLYPLLMCSVLGESLEGVSCTWEGVFGNVPFTIKYLGRAFWKLLSVVNDCVHSSAKLQATGVNLHLLDVFAVYTMVQRCCGRQLST